MSLARLRSLSLGLAWGLLGWAGVIEALAADTLSIERVDRGTDGFGSLIYRATEGDAVVLLRGLDPAHISEPVATNLSSASNGAFRVSLAQPISAFYRLALGNESGDGLSGLPRLALGGAFSVAIRGDGSLWSWGSNFRGALGNGQAGSTNLPTPLGTSGDWVAVASGFNHTLALRSDGTLWGWGENRYGEASGDATGPVLAPAAIAPEARWRWVTAGSWFSLAIRNDGTLWAWGQNQSGQLGLGHRFDTNHLSQVGIGADWVRVAAGPTHTIGLRQDGSLWQWGEPEWGPFTNAPSRIAAEDSWKEVATGTSHAVALRIDGTLWAWGSNQQGLLGIATNRPASSRLPLQVGSDNQWRRIGVASTHSSALRSDGTVWSWGSSSVGALGLGASVVVTNRPTLVTGIGAVREMGVGRDHMIVVQESGSLAGWGNNGSGEVGDGTRERRWAPVPVASDSGWVR